MRDCQDPDVILDGDVREVVRKSGHGDPSDIETRCDPRYRLARSGPLSQESDGRFDGIDQRLAEAGSLIVVPGGSVVEF